MSRRKKLVLVPASFHKVVLNWRNENNITIQQAADMAGVSFSTWWRIESLIGITTSPERYNAIKDLVSGKKPALSETDKGVILQAVNELKAQADKVIALVSSR